MFKTKNRITRVENALDLRPKDREFESFSICLLYTSDAADDMQCVDLGGRRIIKKDGSFRHRAYHRSRFSTRTKIRTSSRRFFFFVGGGG